MTALSIVRNEYKNCYIVWIDGYKTEFVSREAAITFARKHILLFTTLRTERTKQPRPSVL